MANRSSGYYRKNPYKRKSGLSVFIISLSIAVVLFLAFIIVGNLLSKKVSDDTEIDEPKIYTHKTEQTKPEPAATAYNVSVKGKAVDPFSATLKNDAAALSENGYTAASIDLSDKNGALIFSSEVAKRFNYPTSDQNIDLAAVNKKLSDSGLGVSATLSLNSFSEENKTARSVLQSCEAAIVCEIIEVGVDDVLLRLPEIKTENADELISMAERVKEINEKAVVGIVLTPEFLGAENAAQAVDRLLSAFDFLSLDISGLSGEADISEQIQSAISNDTYYYILRYNMRVLVPDLDAEEAAKIYELMSSNSITNWQTVA